MWVCKVAPYRDGGTHLVLETLELLVRLAVLRRGAWASESWRAKPAGARRWHGISLARGTGAPGMWFALTRRNWATAIRPVHPEMSESRLAFLPFYCGLCRRTE